MKTYGLVVAALLLTSLGGMGQAVAADNNPEHRSKNARKVLAVLNAFGINSKEIKSLVETVDRNSDGDYVYFAREEIGVKGRLSLRYPIGEGVRLKKMELHYTPSADSRFNYTLRPDGVMVTYGFHF